MNSMTKDLEDAMPAEDLRSLSKKLFSNYKGGAEHEDVTDDIASLIKSTSEPHSVISVEMRLLAVKNAINFGEGWHGACYS